MKTCSDGGTCHHECFPGQCFRQRHALPLSGSGLDANWQPERKSLMDAVRETTGTADAVLSVIEDAAESQFAPLGAAIRAWRKLRNDALVECTQLLEELEKRPLSDTQHNDLVAQAQHLNRIWAFELSIPEKRFPAGAFRITWGISDKERFRAHLSKTSCPINVLRWWASEPVVRDGVCREQQVLSVAYWIDANSVDGPVRYQFNEIRWPDANGKIALTSEGLFLAELEQYFSDRIRMVPRSL